MGDKSRPPATVCEAVTGYPAPTGYPTATGYPPHPQTPILCKRLLLAFLIVLLLVTVILGILYVVFPHISVFHVSSLSLSNFNTSTSPSFITGNWDVELIAKNTDKKITLHYKEINVSVFYKDVLILETTLPPFDLAKKNQTVVSGRLATAGANVNTWVVDDISKDRSNGSVGFNLELKADVQCKQYGMMKITHGVTIYCEGLELGLTEAAGNASLVGKGDRECKVSGWSD